MPETETPAPAAGPGRSRNASGRAVALNALSGYITLFAGSLIGFVSTPLILRHLGTVRFGTWSLVGATAGYLTLLELGLGVASINRVAAREVEGPRALEEIVSTTIVLYAVIGAVAMAITGLLALVFTSLYSIPPSVQHDATIALLFFGCAVAIQSMVAAFSTLMLGTGRMDRLNYWGFIVSTAVSIATVVAAVLGASLSLLGLIQVIGAVVSWLTLRTVTRRLFPDVRPHPRLASTSLMRTLLSLGWRNAISSILGTLAFGSDLVLIGLLLNPRAAAAYAIGLRGYGFINRFTTGAVSAMGPSHAHRAAAESNERRFDLFCTSVLVILLLGIAVALPVAVYAHGLLHLWLGAVPARSTAVITVFCAVQIVQSPGLAASALLVNSDQATEVMRLTFLSAAVNVIASIVLTATVGVIGPALGSLIAVATIDLTYFPWRACRLLQQSYGEMISRAVLPLVVPTMILAGVLAAGRLVTGHGLLVLPLAGAAAAAYAAALWFTPAVRGLRGRLR